MPKNILIVSIFIDFFQFSKIILSDRVHFVWEPCMRRFPLSGPLHMTHDTWHMKRESWHVTCGGRRPLTQHFISLALLVLEWRYFENIFTKDDSQTQQGNDNGVCRTAPARPDFLNKAKCSMIFCFFKLFDLKLFCNGLTRVVTQVNKFTFYWIEITVNQVNRKFHMRYILAAYYKTEFVSTDKLGVNCFKLL